MRNKISWNKGLTKETDERIKAPSTCFKKGNISHNKGEHLSKETKRKISDTKKRLFQEGKIKSSQLGKHHSEKSKEKMSATRNRLLKEGLIPPMLGKNHSEKTREKLKLINLKNPLRYWLGKERDRKTIEKLRITNIGKKHTDEHKIKISATEQGISLERWEKFVSYEPYDENFNQEIKKLIKERDGCCILCNIGLDDLKLLKRKINIHHINYDKLCSFQQNLITLCNSCHMKTNTNRSSWTKFFQSLLSERYNYEYSENEEIIIKLNEKKNA